MLDSLWRVALRIAHRVLLCWWFVRRPVVHGAFVAVWAEGRLLLVRNSYRRDQSLPSGGVERTETPRDAAARELREEVGIAVAPDDLVFAGEFVLRYEWKHDRAHFFELRLAEEPPLQIDQREVVAASFQTPEQILQRAIVPHLRIYLQGEGLRAPPR